MQAELFILRLSRNSGVLGLAGMPFTSQIFSTNTHTFGGVSNNHGILLVRPLLDFSKEDMYKVMYVRRQYLPNLHFSRVWHRNCGQSSLVYHLQICLGDRRDWVEDPTNQSPLFARNRIRMSLRNLSSGELTKLTAFMLYFITMEYLP